MQNLTLQQIFGENATQDATALVIQKADLSGLSATTNNRGEQLLVALLLQSHQHFEGVLTDEQGRAITDEQGRAIVYNNRNLYQKLNFYFWKRQFNNQYQIDTFIVDIFVTPPTEPQTPLAANSLNY